MSATQTTWDRNARRNVMVLTAAQALGAASPPIVVSLGGLVGQSLSADPTLATLPVSLFNLGLALGTLPAAAVMRRFGRRTGYLFGATFGIAAGLVAALGIAAASFVVFCLGTFTAGFYASYVQSYRFAATDAVSGALRAKAISWVMVGGLAGGQECQDLAARLLQTLRQRLDGAGQQRRGARRAQRQSDVGGGQHLLGQPGQRLGQL